MADLPPHPFICWTLQDKWIVANAVRYGLISYTQACRKYLMHPDELDDWIAKAKAGDKRKLKAIPEPAPQTPDSEQ